MMDSNKDHDSASFSEHATTSGSTTSPLTGREYYDEQASASTGTTAKPFPWILHDMLEDSETEFFDAIVSWFPDGHGFKVHQIGLFAERIIPRYFNQTKYKSFQRQLNFWGFQRVSEIDHRGGYQHNYFVRGRPELCGNMKRVRIKGTGKKRTDPTRNRRSKSILGAKEEEYKPGAAASPRIGTNHNHQELETYLNSLTSVVEKDDAKGNMHTPEASSRAFLPRQSADSLSSSSIGEDNSFCSNPKDDDLKYIMAGIEIARKDSTFIL
jgi:hypothetical protein